MVATVVVGGVVDVADGGAVAVAVVGGGDVAIRVVGVVAGAVAVA